MCFYKNQHKGEDERIGFLEWLCGSSCMMFLGILNWVWNVFCPKKNTYCFVGSLEVFGTEGMLGSSDV
jgi:hypothetical protein